MTHLLVDISAHGLGHLAQTAPVLAELHRRQPEIEFTIISALPRERLARRIAAPFEHLQEASDFGFAMHNAVDIDFVASAQRYREFHDTWAERVAGYAGLLQRGGFDAVLANAAYLPLAAAAQTGIPAIGMCSLNWADLFAHYFGGQPWAASVHRQVLDAYNAADIFLRVSPGMPMHDFVRRREIGPIANLALPDLTRRQRLAAELAAPAADRWVLVAMGGMDFRLPIEEWPRWPGVTWLCPRQWGVTRDDVRDFDAPGLSADFTELLASCDVVLTKPGYGTFVEAACNGTAVLYVPRDDWPEEAPLVEWLERQARVRAVAREQVMAGDLAVALDELLAQPPPPRPLPSGINDAVEAIILCSGHSDN